MNTPKTERHEQAERLLSYFVGYAANSCQGMAAKKAKKPTKHQAVYLAQVKAAECYFSALAKARASQ